MKGDVVVSRVEFLGCSGRRGGVLRTWSQVVVWARAGRQTPEPGSAPQALPGQPACIDFR